MNPASTLRSMTVCQSESILCWDIKNYIPMCLTNFRIPIPKKNRSISQSSWQSFMISARVDMIDMPGLAPKSVWKSERLPTPTISFPLWM
jgi:hypothetical protein